MAHQFENQYYCNFPTATCREVETHDTGKYVDRESCEEECNEIKRLTPLWQGVLSSIPESKEKTRILQEYQRPQDIHECYLLRSTERKLKREWNDLPLTEEERKFERNRDRFLQTHAPSDLVENFLYYNMLVNPPREVQNPYLQNSMLPYYGLYSGPLPQLNFRREESSDVYSSHNEKNNELTNCVTFTDMDEKQCLQTLLSAPPPLERITLERFSMCSESDRRRFYSWLLIFPQQFQFLCTRYKPAGPLGWEAIKNLSCTTVSAKEEQVQANIDQILDLLIRYSGVQAGLFLGHFAGESAPRVIGLYIFRPLLTPEQQPEFKYEMPTDPSKRWYPCMLELFCVDQQLSAWLAGTPLRVINELKFVQPTESVEFKSPLVGTRTTTLPMYLFAWVQAQIIHAGFNLIVAEALDYSHRFWYRNGFRFNSKTCPSPIEMKNPEDAKMCENFEKTNYIIMIKCLHDAPADSKYLDPIPKFETVWSRNGDLQRSIQVRLVGLLSPQITKTDDLARKFFNRANQALNIGK